MKTEKFNPLTQLNHHHHWRKEFRIENVVVVVDDTNFKKQNFLIIESILCLRFSLTHYMSIIEFLMRMNFIFFRVKRIAYLL